MPNNDNKLQSETKEALDRIEYILSAALSFVGQYIATIWHYLLHSSLSTQNSNAEASQGKILKPLSFLSASLLIFSLSYFRVLKELYNANWLKPEFKESVKRIVSYHDLIADSAFKFNIADALILMVPFVLFVALFAKINELISIAVRKKTSIEQQLNSISYFIGTVVSMIALWSLPLLYFMATYKNLEITSTLELSIGFVIMTMAVVTIFTAVFRYLQHAKYHFYKYWILSILVFVFAMSLQTIAMRIAINLFVSS